MTDDVFDHERFRDWLNNHDPNAVVGYQGEPHCCPMATYMNDQGYTNALVAQAGTLVEGDECRNLDHPYWVERFVYHVDGTENNDDPAPYPATGEEITAARALVCLNIAMSEDMHRECEAKLAAIQAQQAQQAQPEPVIDPPVDQPDKT